MTCHSKFAVLPTLHSAVMIIIGVNTELRLTAVTSLLLPLVPSDHTARSNVRNYVNSLHHLHRILLRARHRRLPVDSVWEGDDSQEGFNCTHTPQMFTVVYMYTTKQIPNVSVCQPSMMDLPENVMQTVDFTVWELALLYIKVLGLII